MKALYKNQFSEPISRIIKHIKNLNWRPVFLIPSLIEFVALLIVMIIFIVLWPYGLIPIIAAFLFDLIEDSCTAIKDKTFASAMPYSIAIGIYFLLYFPFFILCLPMYAIGFIGKYFIGFN